jgi:hypothetical protein
MRLSADPTDPAWPGFHLGGVRILLDGIERSDVVTADEEGRHIVRYVRDSAGRLIIDTSTREPMRETLYGTVHIDMPEDTARTLRLLRQGDEQPRQREPRGAHALLREDAARRDGAA